MGQCDGVRASLGNDPNRKWGFVIYRCTYGDDAAWKRFMTHLNTRTRLTLEDYKEGDLVPHIDWNVQEDPALDEASVETVRKKFKQWVKDDSASYWLRGTARHQACVMVDKYFLDSVLNGPPAEKYDSAGKGCVNLVSLNKMEGEFEGEQFIGLSYLVPRAYILLNDEGWWIIANKKSWETSTP